MPEILPTPTCASVNETMKKQKNSCHYCGRELQDAGGIKICLHCNDSRGDFYNLLSDSITDFGRNAEKVMIECPGATLYYPGSDEVAAGAEFIDINDPAKGYVIINHPVYGPKHVRHRWIKKEDAHLIRRCQSCQDHTVRMRRKEGPDLYIPSRKNPNHHPRHQTQRRDQSDRPHLGG